MVVVYDTGYSSFYKMIKESAWGTPITPTLDIGLLEATGNIAENQNVEQNYGTGSRLNNQLNYSKYGVNGSLTGSILNGKLLAYALGTDTPTSTGPTVHTLSQLDTTALNSFTLTQNFIANDKALEVAGCKINDCTISMETGGKLTGTYNWVGKDVTTIATTVGTRTAPTQAILPSYTGTISWAASEIECKSFTFNYSNNLGEDEYSVGDRRRAAITQGQVDMKGSFILVFSGLTEYADFKTTFSTGIETGTARALSFVATTGTTTSLYELSLGLTGVALTERTGAIELSNNRVVAEFNYIPAALGTVTFKDQLITTYIA